MNIDILDCTLRDGGHQNEWRFSPRLAERYLAALDRTGVRFAELGYRTPVMREPGAGEYRFCPDELIHRSRDRLGISVAVMIETKMIEATTAGSTQRAVAQLLGPGRASPIDLVRIATSIDDIDATARIADAVRALGYDVAVNIMRGSTLGVPDLRRAAAALRRSGAGILYLADSFGGLLPDGTRARVNAMGEAFGGRIGFHAHDNMGLALANSIAAMEAGATAIDASVLGMGRGGGNLRTEQLLLFLEKSGRRDLSARPLFEVIGEDFADLHAQYGWGATVPFMLAGLQDLHPDEAESFACR